MSHFSLQLFSRLRFLQVRDMPCKRTVMSEALKKLGSRTTLLSAAAITRWIFHHWFTRSIISNNELKLQHRLDSHKYSTAHLFTPTTLHYDPQTVISTSGRTAWIPIQFPFRNCNGNYKVQKTSNHFNDFPFSVVLHFFVSRLLCSRASRNSSKACVLQYFINDFLMLIPR